MVLLPYRFVITALAPAAALRPSLHFCSALRHLSPYLKAHIPPPSTSQLTVTFMSSPPHSPFLLSSHEHALACLYQAFLLAQPPMTRALQLFAEIAFKPLPPLKPADAIKDRLQGKMRMHFAEARILRCSSL